jgi:hypothetical protein
MLKTFDNNYSYILIYNLRLKCLNANMDRKLQPFVRVNVVFGNKLAVVILVSKNIIIIWARLFL